MVFQRVALFLALIYAVHFLQDANAQFLQVLGTPQDNQDEISLALQLDSPPGVGFSFVNSSQIQQLLAAYEQNLAHPF